MNRVNLIPIQRRRAKARAARVRAWVVANALYFALLGGAGASAYGLLSSDRSVRMDLAKTNQEIDQSGKQLTVVRRELAEVQQTMASVKTVSEQPDWSVLVAVVGKSLGEDVVLSGCDLGQMKEEAVVVQSVSSPVKPSGPHRFLLHLTGLGQSQAAVAEFVRKLEGTELFERVNLLHTTRETLLGSEVVGFELQCPLSNRTGGVP